MTSDDDGQMVTCDHCGYRWEYTGNMQSKTTCPDCQNKTTISDEQEG